MFASNKFTRQRVKALRRSRGDRGVTLITFALSLVAICAVIALVLGGSIGYTAERNSQTASDAAALAAARVMWDVQTDLVADASQVEAVALEVAQENGLDPDLVTCDVVRVNRSVIGPCASATNVRSAQAAGVRVGTTDTRDVPFGEVGGQETISGATTATAAIQPLRSGRSPVMVCSSAGLTAGHPVEILLPDSDQINPAAIGQWFMLWSNGNDLDNGNRRCGLGSEWKGWLDTDQEYTLPGSWKKENGSKTGQRVPRFLTGGCDLAGDLDSSKIDALDGCIIAVPLCSHRVDSNNLYCKTFGTFRLSVQEGEGDKPCFRADDDKKKALCGQLLKAGGVAVGGDAEDALASPGEVVVIKLVNE